MKKKKVRIDEKFGPDCEKHLIALPVAADANVHMIVREHFQSHNWWTFIGFESEDRICKFVTEIEKTPEIVFEKVTWPIIRVGEHTGKRPDNIVLVFVTKTSLKRDALLAIVEKHGAKIADKFSPNVDFFPMTVFGYANALTTAFQSILEQRIEADN